MVEYVREREGGKMRGMEHARTGISGDSSVVAIPLEEFLGTGIRYRHRR